MDLIEVFDERREVEKTKRNRINKKNKKGVARGPLLIFR
jgi:hypothetical protein